MAQAHDKNGILPGTQEGAKVALITGSNKGIGFEVAKELAQSGWHVILTARNESSGQQAKERLANDGIHVDFQPMDVTNRGSIEAAAHWVEKTYGKLDLLVNNAGIYLDEDGPIASVSPNALRQTLETNTLGPLNAAQVFLPLLKKGYQPQIINISSGLGQLEDMEGGTPAAYKLSKAALNVITIMLADELKESGIAVNSLCPGWVKTDMGGNNATRSIPEGANGIVQLAMLAEQAPTGRFMRDLQKLNW